MESLDMTTVESYLLGQVDVWAAVAATILTSTLVVAMSVFLAFRGIDWFKSAITGTEMVDQGYDWVDMQPQKYNRITRAYENAKIKWYKFRNPNVPF